VYAYFSSRIFRPPMCVNHWSAYTDGAPGPAAEDEKPLNHDRTHAIMRLKCLGRSGHCLPTEMRSLL